MILRRSTLPTILLLSLFALLAPEWAEAQSRTTSAVRGRVTGPDGQAIPGATVTIRRDDTGTARSTTTNDAGLFQITVLQPGGPYTLVVQYLGMADTERTGIMLQVGERVALQLRMETSALEVEGIEVAVERTEIFNPSQVGAATRLDEVQLEALPIISRNLMDLAILSPLVKATEDGGFSVLGQNDRYNAILVDGVSNKDAFGLTAGGVPGGQAGARIIPFDAVSQYEVLVAPFDVRLSGFTGGVLNAVTRTGTNEWRTRASAILRNESLTGDLNLPTGPVAASGVDRELYAFSVGGPIKLNRAHFFLTGEFEERTQPPTGFNLERDDPTLVRVSEGTTSEFARILQEQHGVDAGAPGPIPLDTRIGNVFGRFDWDFGNGTRMTIRNVFSDARNDESPNRDQFQPYGFSSNGVLRESLNNTTSLQLFSNVGASGANELTITAQRTVDRTEPVVDYPQLGVDAISSVGDVAFRREIRAGAQLFAQENDLEQTTVRLTESLSLTSDSTTWTIGVTGAYYDIKHTFLPAADGDWYFASMDDFALNAPQRYQRSVLGEGQSPTAAFRIAEAGIFAQQEIDARERVTLRFGLRVDVPWVLDEPGRNEEVFDIFGLDTSALPSGQVLISPRLGFNVQTGTERRGQIRGGFGLFTGQIPFVWLSNAFHNDGLRSTLQVCEGRKTDDPLSGNTAPEYTSGPAPTTCWFNPDTQRSAPPTVLQQIVAFDPEFKYPQELRFSSAWDQEIGDDTSISFGLLFTHAIHQVVLEDANLGKPTGNPGDLDGYGGLDRRIFGRPSNDGFDPNRDYPQFEQVLVASNESRDWAFSVTAEMRGRLAAMRYQLGYTYGRSFDRMSLQFTDMISNYGFNPTSKDPNESSLRPSNFDLPHKVIASVFGAPIPAIPEFEVSLLYSGQSGVPFSYVYEGDLNGDGFPGLGGAFDRNNDLLYVPQEASEVPSGFATIGLLANALNNDRCLMENRGEILQRNACRAPWQNRLDLRMAYNARVGNTEIRFEGDLINVLNLVNEDWGNIETVQPNVPLLKPFTRTGGGFNTPGPTLVSQWAGAVLPGVDEEGRLVATEPWSILSPDSQWQAQFGIRVTFDSGPGR